MFSSRMRFNSIAFLLMWAVFAVAGSAVMAQPGSVQSFAALAKRVEPAVVSIDTKSTAAPGPIARATPAPGASDEIMDFFRRQMQSRPVYAVGSGFIVDKAGYIITNEHVIDDATRITVKLDSGEEYPAK